MGNTAHDSEAGPRRQSRQVLKEKDGVWELLLAKPITDIPRRRLTHKAAVQLSEHPAELVAGLKQRVTPVPKRSISRERILRWIDALDSDSFDERERATKELVAAGDKVRLSAADALTRGVSLEAKVRLERVKQCLDESFGRPELAPLRLPEELRTLRALQALENSTVEEAEEVLAKFAEGDDDAVLTRQAELALERLKRKSRQ
jgi:hypothetical protein